MFKKRQLSIIEWLGLLLLMMIPIVNLIVFLYILIAPGVNTTLRNFMLALLIAAIISWVFSSMLMPMWSCFIDFIPQPF